VSVGVRASAFESERALVLKAGVGGASINFIRPWLLAAGLLGKWLADCQCMIGSGGMHQSALARCGGSRLLPNDPS
jgi:hypothetical protein